VNSVGVALTTMLLHVRDVDRPGWRLSRDEICQDIYRLNHNRGLSWVDRSARGVLRQNLSRKQGAQRLGVSYGMAMPVIVEVGVDVVAGSLPFPDALSPPVQIVV